MKRICVINRGEIACNIIDAIHDVGMVAVALYSKADENSLFVSKADEAYYIGEAPAKKSYLNIPVILDVLKENNIDAVHPGYGFLSENSEFCNAVIELGIKWIGPSSENMNLMAKKDVASKVAKEAGASVLESSECLDVNSIDDIVSKANQITYPLLVKAVSGGGGIGMKLIEDEEQLKVDTLATSKMAEAAFGDGSVYLEKYIQEARHIEIQVFGFEDKVLHFHERECSIQRRFQKVLEETHACNIDPDKILEIADDAVKIANYINYQGAGTVEFIYDNISKKHYFLEMNTRIQVEYPVTQNCTDTNLLQLQILYAFNMHEPMLQEDILHKGHSLQCRIYAENPKLNFMPCPGLITKLSFLRDSTIEIKTGVSEGDKITHYYDPMIAKIVVTGDTREEAIKNMEKALNNATIEGISTNIEFLKNILKTEEFICGNISTQFIPNHLKKLIKGL